LDRNRVRQNVAYLVFCIFYLDDDKCTDGEVQCRGSSQCVSQGWLCDEHNDCDNGWDEDQETCGQFAY